MFIYMKTNNEMKMLIKDINMLQRACLVPGYSRVTTKTIAEVGMDETLRYFRWLCQQAPMTALRCKTNY